MRIWDKVCKTDPKFTKSFRRGNTQLTDINPQHRLQVLTELFGPAGIGWGTTIHERWIDVWGSTQCAYVMLSIWYIGENDVRHETPVQIGGTLLGESPDEIWKMSITDAVGKCCAMLGIAADVYLGVFDGKYRREMDGTGDVRPEPPPHFAVPPKHPAAPAPNPPVGNTSIAKPTGIQPVKHNPQSVMQQRDDSVPF